MDGDEAWTRVGAVDPYFGVLSHDAFRADRLSPEALERFWGTGREHVAGVLAELDAVLGPRPRPASAVDFGCGVGRLVAALAPHADEVHGVDVSPTMLAEAAANVERLGLTNVRLHVSDATLSQVPDGVDLVHSVLVFQHVPPDRGLGLLTALAGRLRPGGAGYVQVSLAVPGGSVRRAARTVTSRSALARRVAGVVQPTRSPAARWIRMYDYDLADVLLALAQAGVPRASVRVHVRDDGGRDALLVFQRPPA